MSLLFRAYPYYQGNWNEHALCSQLPSVDLRFWQEVPPPAFNPGYAKESPGVDTLEIKLLNIMDDAEKQQHFSK